MIRPDTRELTREESRQLVRSEVVRPDSPFAMEFPRWEASWDGARGFGLTREIAVQDLGDGLKAKPPPGP